MALTFTTVIDKGTRAWKLGGGLQAALVDMTTSVPGTDYTATGFPVQANAAKFGMRKVFFVAGISIRAAAGAPVFSKVGVWDATNGSIRALEQEAAAPLAEVEAADFTANDVIRFLAFGV